MGPSLCISQQIMPHNCVFFIGAIDAVNKHEQAYKNDSHGDENTIGTAAAMQALKMFNQSNNSSSSGAGQAAFLGMAMSEASKVSDFRALSTQICRDA